MYISEEHLESNQERWVWNPTCPQHVRAAEGIEPSTSSLEDWRSSPIELHGLDHPDGESNPDLQLRKLVCSPLHHPDWRAAYGNRTRVSTMARPRATIAPTPLKGLNAVRRERIELPHPPYQNGVGRPAAGARNRRDSNPHTLSRGHASNVLDDHRHRFQQQATRRVRELNPVLPIDSRV